MTKSEKTAHGIEAIVERTVSTDGTMVLHTDHGDLKVVTVECLRFACLAVAKAVVEEAARLAPHDLDCHDEDAPCENDACDHGCDETCPQRRIRALAAQGPGGEKSDG